LGLALSSLLWALAWSVSVHLVTHKLSCIDHDLDATDTYAEEKTSEYAPCVVACMQDDRCVWENSTHRPNTLYLFPMVTKSTLVKLNFTEVNLY
jgi:hypothetical protein